VSPLRILPLLPLLAAQAQACVDWEALGPPQDAGAPTLALAVSGDLVVRASGDGLQLALARADGALEPVASAAVGAVDLAFSGGALLAWLGPQLRVYAPPFAGELQPHAVVDFVDDQWIVSAALVGGTLFACTGRPSLNPWVPDHRLLAVDLSDPAQPLQLGQIGSLALLAERDGRLVTGGDGLSLLDVGDPLQPVELAHAGTGWVSGMAFDGARAALALDDGWRLEVLDVADPLAPRSLDTVELEWGGDWDVVNVFRLAWANDDLVLANKNGGFLGFRLTAAGELQACGPLPAGPLNPYADAVAVAGGRLWLGEGWVGAALASLPLFGPPPAVALAIVGGDARLGWDAGAADLWTVARCADPAFPPALVETLGSTEWPEWTDAGALARGRSFYRVAAGRP